MGSKIIIDVMSSNIKEVDTDDVCVEVNSIVDVIESRIYVDNIVSNIPGTGVDIDDDDVENTSIVDVIGSKSIFDLTVSDVDTYENGVQYTSLSDVKGSK